MSQPLSPPSRSLFELDYVGVKVPQFSFTRLVGADPRLGVEMASTGEVACLGTEVGDAFLKGYLSAGNRLPARAALVSTGALASKVESLPAVQTLHRRGIALFATPGTARFLESHGVPCETIAWPLDDAERTALDLIRDGTVDLVINIPKDLGDEELDNGYLIRRHAVDFGVPLLTNPEIMALLIDSWDRFPIPDLECRSWETYVQD
jgi:carbamoyl-phosphate synthase large subunit